MFGFGFESKVKDVLKRNFHYQPGGPQLPILNSIAAEAKRQNLNEYDAAIMFMMVQMNALSVGQPETRTFVDAQSRHIESVLSLARSPYADIVAMLSEIKTKHAIAGSSNRGTSVGADFPDFESWLREFKRACGEVNSGLVPDKEGKSLVDFMDQEPLRNAYRDGVPPRSVGVPFAKQFDVQTFGRRR